MKYALVLIALLVANVSAQVQKKFKVEFVLTGDSLSLKQASDLERELRLAYPALRFDVRVSERPPQYPQLQFDSLIVRPWRWNYLNGPKIIDETQLSKEP